MANTLSLGRAQGSSARTTPLAKRATDARWFLRGGGGGAALKTVGWGVGCAWGSSVARGRWGGGACVGVCTGLGRVARHDGVRSVPRHCALPLGGGRGGGGRGGVEKVGGG